MLACLWLLLLLHGRSCMQQCIMSDIHVTLSGKAPVGKLHSQIITAALAVQLKACCWRNFNTAAAAAAAAGAAARALIAHVTIPCWRGCCSRCC
jgi:hypothetical protein